MAEEEGFRGDEDIPSRRERDIHYTVCLSEVGKDISLRMDRAGIT